MNKTERARTGGHSATLTNLLTILTLILLSGFNQAQAQSQWTTNGNNVSNTNTGNVGIGTTAPAAKLDVAGTVNIGGNLTFPSYPSSIIGAGLTSISLYSGTIVLDGANTDIRTRYINLYDSRDLTIGGNSSFPNQKVLVSTYGGMVVTQGNVGIGTSTPATKLHVVGDITVTGNIAAKYQDVAEWVPARQAIAPGTVVVLDPEQVNQVRPSAEAYDTRVAGVVSEKPGLTLGESGTGKVLVATTGRVLIKVDATRAAIHIGDLLVTSDVAGVAMKSEPIKLGGRMMHMPGTLIGKALEPLERGTGAILVLLSLQ